MIITERIENHDIQFSLDVLDIDKTSGGVIYKIKFCLEVLNPNVLFSLKRQGLISETLRYIAGSQLSQKYPTYNIRITGGFFETITSRCVKLESDANFEPK